MVAMQLHRTVYVTRTHKGVVIRRALNMRSEISRRNRLPHYPTSVYAKIILLDNKLTELSGLVKLCSQSSVVSINFTSHFRFLPFVIDIFIFELTRAPQLTMASKFLKIHVIYYNGKGIIITEYFEIFKENKAGLIYEMSFNTRILKKPFNKNVTLK